MAKVDLKSLVVRLNETCRTTLEAAAGLALTRTNYNVEIEHWLAKLLAESTCDLSSILAYFNIDIGRVHIDVNRALDKSRSGNSRPPGLSSDIVTLMKDAWLLASIEGGEGQIRSAFLLWAMLADEGRAMRLTEISSAFAPLSADLLKRDFAKAVAASTERTSGAFAPGAGGGDAASPGAGGSPADALARFTVDLTAEARSGRIDPILGRDEEIRQLVDILSRRRQNNPILTGEAGVGKTAVVEGFALRIAAGDVPLSLRNVTLRSLDLGLLQAGAGMKGEFESRLRGVIDGVKASPEPVILFIDEAHTLIGAGGAAGQGDAANLLKPALARGELRTIAATTWAEYKKYFEKDAALTRRFQVVKVEEPSETLACAMLRGMVPVLEKFHGVRITTEAVDEAVRLSARFIPSRQLPDKAVSLLDTACSRVSVSQTTIPAAVEDRRKRIAVIERELDLLARDELAGSDHRDRAATLSAEKETLDSELKALDERLKRESELVNAIADLRAKLEADGQGEERDAARVALQARMAELAEAQSQDALVFALVDGQVVANVVQNWTGIPAGRMRNDEIMSVLALRETMEKRIVGQGHALDAVAQSIFTARARLTDPRKPLGVFLMVGPSGVGKTETALTLADMLYGGEQNLTTINMSEFKEEHKVSLLMGSPPGYVGYGEGGVLTEAVRRKPYSVVLLDEMEKAHPGVQDVFFQVFDKGNMKDGEGRDIDFKNTVIIMTSNAASDLVEKLCADPESAPDAEALADAIKPELMKYYKAAFLGRVTLVPYMPLRADTLRKIIGIQLKRIETRLHDAYKARFEYDPEVVEAIAQRCVDSASGARNVENILSKTILPALSAEILRELSHGNSIGRVRVSVAEDGRFSYALG